MRDIVFNFQEFRQNFITSINFIEKKLKYSKKEIPITKLILIDLSIKTKLK